MKRCYVILIASLINIQIGEYFALKSQTISPVRYIKLTDIVGYSEQNNEIIREIDTSLYVGTIAGTANVFSTGAANYQIPIVLPPGTSGMIPQISVLYNSQTGNGQLGMSFDLAGLSAITRVSKFYYYDQFTESIELDTTDRFAIDGSRLFKVSGAYYGSNDSEYKTEIEAFSRIKAYEASGSGPKWFKVETKNGDVIEFGNTPDSRAEVPGTQTVYLWRINRITDNNGNYIRFHYAKDSDGDSRITRIDYTGNDLSGLVPYNSIEFLYGIRSDNIDFYIHGKKISQKYLLTHIKVSSENTLARDYFFKYSYDSSQSRLIEIIEKGSDESQKNSTIIEWGESYGDFYTSQKMDIPFRYKQLFPVDINLNGRSDLFVLTKQTEFGNWSQWHLYINEGDKKPFLKINSGNLPPDFKGIIISDVNHDGVDDILFQVEDILTYECNHRPCNDRSGMFTQGMDPESVDLLDPVQGSYLNSICFDLCTYKVTSLLFYRFQNDLGLVRGSSDYDIRFSLSDLKILNGDFNGDGKLDLLAIDSKNNFRGIRGFQSYNSPNFDSPDDIYIVDTDGTGKNEIFIRKNLEYKFFRFNNRTNLFEIIFEGSFANPIDKIAIGDFNGDGKTDFFVRSRLLPGLYMWTIYNSNGLGFDSPTQYSNFFWSKDFIISDLNGDGRDDIVHITENGANSIRIRCYYSDGLGTFNTSESYGYSVIYTDIREITFMDVWGEGKKSIIINDITKNTPWYDIYDWSSSFKILSFKRGEQKNLVKSIIDGFNIKHSFEYISIASEDPNVYQSGSGAVFPVMDAVIPLFVVKSMKVSHPLEGELLNRNYYYEGLKIHRQGKGLLGFSKVTLDDMISGFRTTSEFEFDPTFFYSSLKRQTKGLTNGTLTSETIFTNNLISLGNKRFLPYVSQSISKDMLNNNTITTTYRYDNFGNPVNIVQTYNDGASVVTNNTFTAAGGWGIPNKILETTVTNHLPVQSSFSRGKRFTYDSNGNLLTEISDPGKDKAITSTFSYNLAGLPVRVESTAGGLESRYTEHEYDSKFRFVVKTRNSLIQEYEKSYDPITGNVIWEKAINGNETSYQYDGFGRLVGTVTPRNNIISQSVTWNNSLPKSLYVITTTPPVGRQTKAYYDALGREIMTETLGLDAWVRTTKTYNNKGQLVTSTQPHFVGQSAKSNTFTYDEFGRPITQNNNGLVSSFSYAPNKTTITNPAGRISSKETNARGQLITATDEGGTIHYEYHTNGQPKKISALGSVTEMTYDDYGMQTELSEPNAGFINYSYNAYGELVSQTDANGNTFTMIYDRLGRIMSKTSPEGTTAYQYISSGNGTGQLGSVTAPGNISEAFEYNGYGELMKITESIDDQVFITSFEYDLYGRNNKIIYPSGTFLIKSYSPTGYLAASHTGGTGSNHTAYVLKNTNALGQPLLVESYLGMGIWPPLRTTYTYDDYNLPENVKSVSNTTIQDDWFVFDPYTGNLQSRENKLKNLIESFTYDNLNRLTGVSNPASPMSLTYQPNGNILNKTGVGDYAYHAQKLHAVTSVTNSHGIIPETVQDITYTSFNKTAVIEEGNKKLVFTYGPDNERKKSELYENDILVTTRYYVGSYEKEISNGVTREFLYLNGPSGLLGVRISDGSQYDTTYYFLKDYLGSITGIVNLEGNVEQYLSYDAWGRRRNPNDWSYNNVAQNFLTDRGYTSHEHHDAFALINMNGRMYDPVLGRVLSPDNFVQLPDFSQNFNRYSYAWNNPLVYTDPDGNFILIPALIGAAVNVIMNGINNLDNGQAFFKGAGVSAITGAVGGALSATIGFVATEAFTGFGKVAFQTLAHGHLGGMMTAFEGGTYGQGLFSGALGSLAASGTESLLKNTNKAVQSIGTIASGGAMGGAGALMAGGNFWQGARNGLISAGLNHLMHEAFDGPPQEEEIYGDRVDLLNSDEPVIDILKAWKYRTKESDVVLFDIVKPYPLKNHHMGFAYNEKFLLGGHWVQLYLPDYRGVTPVAKAGFPIKRAIWGKNPVNSNLAGFYLLTPNNRIAIGITVTNKAAYTYLKSFYNDL